MSDDTLAALAARAGIYERYHDLSGTEHVTGVDTYRALLVAMGLPSEGAAVGERLSELLAADAARALPAEVVLVADEATTLIPSGGAADWQIVCEDGSNLSGTGSDEIHLPPLPCGYHGMWRGPEFTLIMAAPGRAPSVRERTGSDRIWGAATSLYGLRSARNHGIGDYEDLACTAEALAAGGADFLGINPVHALGSNSALFSPYSPSHRGMLNTRHIALDRVPNIETSAAARAVLDQAGDAIRTLRAAELVDYPGTHGISQQALRALFDGFEERGVDTDRAAAFMRFRRGRGAALETFAAFEVIAQLHGPNPARWPANLQHVESDEVRTIIERHAPDIRFHIYQQWLADEQMAEAQARATHAGMRLGLYTDLAVGIRPDGAEPWARPNAFARGVSLGVPADGFNPLGQVWGLAPVNPHGLSAAGYAPLIETLRSVMRYAGVLRVDHAIGLMRCFWVPAGGLPGAYVRYPLRVILAIIRIEATRAGCIVVGEDLGVVPDGLRSELDASGLYGVSVMQFERDGGGFRDPKAYPKRALASFGTHDTPTLAGYWEGADIAWRVELAQFDTPAAEHVGRGRAEERRQILEMLAGIQALPPEMDSGVPPAEMTMPLNVAVHVALSNTSAEMIMMQLDDALGSTTQVNFPGTVDEYPNWRIKCSIPVDAVSTDRRLGAVMEALAKTRPRQDADVRNEKA